MCVLIAVSSEAFPCGWRDGEAEREKEDYSDMETKNNNSLSHFVREDFMEKLIWSLPPTNSGRKYGIYY